jgi:hypothetical protein
MATVLDLLPALGAPGQALAWLLVVGGVVALWVRFERARTAVLIERQRRVRLRRAARRRRS